MNALANWSSFFSAEVGASAALVGLVTVAISINLNRILEVEHLPARAAESLFALTTTFATCSIALFPGILPHAFGGAAIVLALLTLWFGAHNQFTYWRQAGWEAKERHLIAALARLAATLPVCVGGVLLMGQSGAGLDWIAAGVVVSLAAAVLNAWVLLVEIMR